MPQSFKELTIKGFGLIAAAALFGAAFLGIRIGISFIWNLLPENVEVETPIVPREELPFTSTGSSSASSEKTISLLSDSYIPPADPFSESNYKKVPRIIYLGAFDKMYVKIEGEIISDQEVMLLFNFGQETGIIKGARKSSNLIDLQRTRELGGIFSPLNSISTTVNLLGDQLGSSSKNLKNCKEGTCNFTFIKESIVPEVAPILVIPLTIDGKFGGASIKKLDINYECAPFSIGCDVLLCTDETSYQCILNKRSKEEADMWAERYFRNQKSSSSSF